MELLMLGKRLAVIVPTLALIIVGCSDTTSAPEETFGCQYAYGTSYMCYRHIPASPIPIYETTNVKECIQFAGNLEEGVYWLKGIDESGKEFVVKEIVGQEGWRFDGVVSVGSYLYDPMLDINGTSWTHSNCELENVSSDSIRGNCERHYAVKGLWCDAQSSEECMKNWKCSKETCSFALPVGETDSTGLTASIQCLRPDLWFTRSGGEDSVSVTVSDSVISIVIPNLTVTWTKRPGL